MSLLKKLLPRIKIGKKTERILEEVEEVADILASDDDVKRDLAQWTLKERARDIAARRQRRK